MLVCDWRMIGERERQTAVFFLELFLLFVCLFFCVLGWWGDCLFFEV